MVVANNLRTFEAAAFGVRGDGQTDDAARVLDALNAAVAQSGGRVVLPVGSVVLVGATVAIPSGVELVVPVSCTLRLKALANVSVVSMAGVGAKLSGGGTIDGNRANNAVGAWHGVAVTGTDAAIEDVTITGCRTNGVDLTGATRATIRGLTVTDCGQHGVGLTDASRNVIADLIAYDNSKVAAVGAGDAVNLAGSSSQNIVMGVTAYDTGGGAARQGYAVREAAGMTGDRNVMASAVAYAGGPGNVSVVGANSGIQAAAGPDYTRALRSFLTNGGLEQWQRGIGPFTTTALYGPDRFYLTLAGGSTLSISRDVADVGLGSLYAAAFAYTHVAAGSATLSQKIENFELLRGQSVVLSALVQSNVPGTCRLRVWDGTTNYHSAYNVAAGLETLSVAVAVPPGATTLEARVVWDVASCVGKVDNMALVQGAIAPTWSPVPAGQDLEACQRYYQEMGGLLTTELLGVLQATAATTAFGFLPFPVEMAITPTATVSAPGDFQVFDAGGAGQTCTALVLLPTRRATRITATVAAGLVAGNAAALRAATTLNARLRFEANP